MTAKIILADKIQTRQLIFEAKGGILSARESKALEEYLAFSAKLYIGAIHGKLCCAWGLIPPTLISDQAYLWLFSTEAVDEYKFLFVRNSQRAIEEMLEEWPIITGFCDLTNARSMRWLRWLGATFGDPIPPMIPFTIRKSHG